MIRGSDPTISFRLDPLNPGNFFACCGLLELADRLWGEADGWFDEDGKRFCIHSIKIDPDFGSAILIDRVARCHLTNTMTTEQLQRRDDLSEIPGKQRALSPLLELEKKRLDSLWREEPILLHDPFNLRIDWFTNERTGGSVFKTWAGQQSVLDITRNMKKPIETQDWSKISSEDWLFWSVNNNAVSFNFDSDLGGVGSDRDVGFSFDPLKISVQTRPLVEFFSFVGLQRFRPMMPKGKNLYRYSLWFEPLPPEVAAVAACGLLDLHISKTFEFRLLYRTKYLKSFLPSYSIR